MNNQEPRELPLKKIGRQVAFLETDDTFVRKGEGAFLRLKDGSILHAYTEYCGGNIRDHGAAEIAVVRSCDEGETWQYEGILLGSPFWLVYNLMSRAYGASVGSVLAIISIATALIRYHKKAS